MTKEAKIYNEKKTASSINSVGKTGQPPEKESRWTLSPYSHIILKITMADSCQCMTKNTTIL